MKPSEHQKAILQEFVSIGKDREEQRKRAIQVSKSTKTRLEYLQLRWLDKTTIGKSVAESRRSEIRRHRALERWFWFIDKDGGGSLDAEELEEPLISSGLAFSRAEVVRLIQAVDEDGSGEVEFDEFLEIVENHTNDPQTTEKEEIAGNQGHNPIKELIKRLDSGRFGDPDQLDLSTRLTAHRRKLIMAGMLAQMKGVTGSRPKPQGAKAATTGTSRASDPTPGHEIHRRKAARTVEAIEQYTRWQRSKLASDRLLSQKRDERRLRRRLRRLGVSNPRAVDPAEYERYLRQEALAMLEMGGTPPPTPLHGGQSTPSTRAQASPLRLRTLADHMEVDVFDDPLTGAEAARARKRDERRRAIAEAQRNRQWSHARHHLCSLAREVLADRNAQDRRSLQTRRDIAAVEGSETRVRHAPVSSMLRTGVPTRTRDRPVQGTAARIEQYLLRAAIERSHAKKQTTTRALSSDPLSAESGLSHGESEALSGSVGTGDTQPQDGGDSPPAPQDLLPSYFAKSLLRRRDAAGPSARVHPEILAVAGAGAVGGQPRGSPRRFEQAQRGQDPPREAGTVPAAATQSSPKQIARPDGRASSWSPVPQGASPARGAEPDTIVFSSELTGTVIRRRSVAAESPQPGHQSPAAGSSTPVGAGETPSNRASDTGPPRACEKPGEPTGGSELERSIRASLRRVPLVKAAELLGRASPLGQSLRHAAEQRVVQGTSGAATTAPGNEPGRWGHSPAPSHGSAPRILSGRPLRAQKTAKGAARPAGATAAGGARREAGRGGFRARQSLLARRGLKAIA